MRTWPLGASRTGNDVINRFSDPDFFIIGISAINPPYSALLEYVPKIFH
jgi:hypothetical protein